MSKNKEFLPMKYMIQNSKTNELIPVRFKNAYEAAVAARDAFGNTNDWEIIPVIPSKTEETKRQT